MMRGYRIDGDKAGCYDENDDYDDGTYTTYMNAN